MSIELAKQIVPCFDQVLIKPDALEREVSGILIENERPQRGEVIGVGPDVKSVKVGNSICVSTRFKTRFTYEGEIYFVVEEEDIVGKFN